MRYETIYGETFEVIKPRKRQVTKFVPGNWDYADIYEAYGRPSLEKVEVWKYWHHYGMTNNERYYIGYPWITAHNTFTFTLTINVYDNDNDGEFLGIMVITRDHNRLYLA